VRNEVRGEVRNEVRNEVPYFNLREKTIKALYVSRYGWLVQFIEVQVSSVIVQ
jgi:hypothetical protein